MITSTSNDTVKRVRRLQQDARTRRREKAFVVEGSRWLQEATAWRHAPQIVLYTEQWASRPEQATLLAQIESPAQEVSEEVMAAMSDMHTPPGVIAVMPQRPLPLPPEPLLLLILDRVRTPGNLGTMLRTAAAAGAGGVLLAPGCVDPYNPKVVRGGMGAQLRLPVHNLDWGEIEDVTAGMKVWLAAANGEQTYTAVDWGDRSALVIGSEASGAGEGASALSSGRVRIPMHAETESLNAAMAAGIILFEAVRQRRRSAHD